MTSLEPVLLGVDVGGTTTAAGLVTRDGQVLSAVETRTHRDGPGTATQMLLALVGDLIAQARDRGVRVDGIGIGVPGIVDVDAGTMRKGIHRIPELTGVPLVDLIQAQTRVPVFVDNDVNALGLGEWTWGPGRGAASMVMLALGTGAGGAIVVDGQLVRGSSGYGGELGHVSVNFAGRRCLCGVRGCLAAYASGYGLAAEYQRRTDGGSVDSEEPSPDVVPDGEAVFRAAGAGDADAREIIEEACRALGAAIGAIANGLNPAVIVLTGGLLKSLAQRERQILEYAAEYGFATALADAAIHFVPGYKNQTVRGGAALVVYEEARRARIS